MNEEQFILLAIKVLSGNHQPGDEAELRRQLEHFPAFRSVFEGLKTYWQADDSPPIDADAALARAWDKIGNPVATESEPASTIPMRRRSYKWIGIAAAVLLPLLAFWLFYPGKKAPVEWAEKFNPNGVRSMIILPDGTKIWLNADSRLEYPVAFGEHEREIRLMGEAFLDVAKDPSRPFIVRLSKGAIRVLGTSFDIRAYKDEAETRTSVTSGLVAFIAGSDSVSLHPNEKAVLSDGTVWVSPTDAEADHNWINGILVFNNRSLREIGKELERYFGKPLRFSDESTGKYRYTATFRNNSEEEILTTLKKVKPFHFNITDKYIEIGR